MLYELAFNLGKFVYEIENMPYDEFVGWQSYFDIQPVGWREDDRTLKLLQIQGFKGEASSIFQTFARIKATSVREETPLEKSTVFAFMKNARGGDNIGDLIGTNK